MRGVEVYRLDLRQSCDVVCFGIERRSLVGRRSGVVHSDRVLDEPFIDCLGWVRHENPTVEVGLCKDVR